MRFSGREKEAIAHIWDSVSSHVDDYGAEAMERLFVCYPQTKTYFANVNLDHGSPAVRKQGSKVLKAIGLASKSLDNLDAALSNLSDLHAHKLRVDPANFDLLNHCFLIVMSIHLSHDFSPSAHAAWDKFQYTVSKVLCSKYR